MPEQPPRGRQRPSIYDVAERAGVSHMTVSRVLNNHPNIRASTRDRVLKAIEQTNYTRSSIARALATRRAMRIGVVVDNAAQYGPNCTLRALESAARGAGYAISVFSASADDHSPHMDAGVDDLVAQGVDALCLIAPRVPSLAALRRQQIDLPSLVVTSEPHPELHTAAVDQRAGALMAVNHLRQLGHRAIAHVAGPSDWFDARVRENAWRDALEMHVLPAAAVGIGDWTPDSGYRFATSHDFAQTTAVFAANDQMALGVIHGLAERGIRVPQDVSVVGFDDIPDAAHYLPPLTTVRQDFAALGALALKLIVAAIDQEPAADVPMIAPQLIVRSSTAPPRA